MGKFSTALLDAIEAQLGVEPEPTADIYRRLTDWSFGSVRHALGALAASGRASFVGSDGHRRYYRPQPGTVVTGTAEPRRRADVTLAEWREYAARGNGEVILPDHVAIAVAMRGLRFDNVSAAELRRETLLPSWHARPLPERRIFDDPLPGRRHAAGHSGIGPEDGAADLQVLPETLGAARPDERRAVQTDHRGIEAQDGAAQGQGLTTREMPPIPPFLQRKRGAA